MLTTAVNQRAAIHFGRSMSAIVGAASKNELKEGILVPATGQHRDSTLDPNPNTVVLWVWLSWHERPSSSLSTKLHAETLSVDGAVFTMCL